MSEQVVIGTVSSIGGKEMSADGKNEKPRKVVVDYSPDKPMGKTLRCWSNTEMFQTFRQAQDSGEQLEVHYTINPIPGTDFTQNMVTEVLTISDVQAQSNGSGPSEAETQPSPGGDHSPPPASNSGGSATHATRTTGDPSKLDYWEQRAIKDEERSAEMEAAWAIGQLLHLNPAAEDEEIVREAKRLIVLKRKLAKETRQGW
jgi:hypothetical protein